MKILSVSLSNFASYKSLDFQFDDKGLVLISGPTGSGKSTLMDAIPWILFGKTAKGGNADEVISWNEDTTQGIIRFEINGVVNAVTRERGARSDLYLSDTAPRRGANIQDTQKFINQLLEFDYDMYMASAYYHEFSQTAQFFTTTAKNRRQITEQLVDLSLPIKLADSIKADQKALKIDLSEVEGVKYRSQVNVDTNTQVLKHTVVHSQQWGMQQATRIQALQLKSDSFEVTKAHKIKTLNQAIIDIGYEPETANYDTATLEANLPPELAPCETCGSPKPNPERQATIEVIEDIKAEARLHQAKGKELNAIYKQLADLQSSVNTYLEQIKEIKSQTNPHADQIIKLEKNLLKHQSDLVLANTKYDQLKDQELNLELLSDAVTTFRSELVRTTIESLELQTNTLLQDHFESEIQVKFNIAECDKLEVIITKDGNEAAYTQLSKGQRGILKLAFGTAVMKTISKHNNLDIKQLFFDEPLSGFDENMKLKAVKLFETLALGYDAVYFIEHSDTIRAMIDNKYHVELVDGVSTISHE